MEHISLNLGRVFSKSDKKIHPYILFLWTYIFLYYLLVLIFNILLTVLSIQGSYSSITRSTSMCLSFLVLKWALIFFLKGPLRTPGQVRRLYSWGFGGTCVAREEPTGTWASRVAQTCPHRIADGQGCWWAWPRPRPARCQPRSPAQALLVTLGRASVFSAQGGWAAARRHGPTVRLGNLCFIDLGAKPGPSAIWGQNRLNKKILSKQNQKFSEEEVWNFWIGYFSFCARCYDNKYLLLRQIAGAKATTWENELLYFKFFFSSEK